MNWINVKDKMPEDDKIVLITDGKSFVAASYGEVYVCLKGYVKEWYPENVSSYEYIDIDLGEITHWCVPDLQ